MREIKFRTWFKLLKRMYIVREMKFNRDNKIVVITNHTGGTSPNSYEIMQFTGLKDKNGKEIFEGDILQSENKDYTFKIIWNEEWARFDYEIIWSEKKNCIHDIRLGRPERYSIIGNTYENPKLLKHDVNVAESEGEGE